METFGNQISQHIAKHVTYCFAYSSYKNAFKYLVL